MKKKLLAVLGAAALTLSVAGVALAEDLLAGQVGNTLGSFTEDCDGWNGDTIGAGQVGVHFVLTTPESDSGSLTAAFSNPSSSVGPVANGEPQAADALHFWVVITGDANTTIDSASTDTDGGNLVISHVCFGGPGGGGGGDTDQPPTDALAAPTGSSGPTDTAWLLVVALGVLLASIVVLTPARAKSKR
jgi:hypothetical protein